MIPSYFLPFWPRLLGLTSKKHFLLEVMTRFLFFFLGLLCWKTSVSFAFIPFSDDVHNPSIFTPSLHEPDLEAQWPDAPSAPRPFLSEDDYTAFPPLTAYTETISLLQSAKNLLSRYVFHSVKEPMAFEDAPSPFFSDKMPKKSPITFCLF